jgi:UDP-N-acetylglucosamine transferase subunit ALG13
LTAVDGPPEVLVTVGMGRFPFDRLVRAVEPLCQRWRVVAQTGCSRLRLPCEQHRFLPADALLALLDEVPVIITHGGNTVRLVQTRGKVPVAVPRRATFGEMADDHQVAYLERERAIGRVIVVEPETAALIDAVARHPERAATLVATRPLPAAVDGASLADRLDAIVGPLVARRQKRRRGQFDAGFGR